MADKAASDYGKILQSADLQREINPLCCNVEDMLMRLDEFETLFANVRAETNIIRENQIAKILTLFDQFEDLRQKIDDLDIFIAHIEKHLYLVEQTVVTAEQTLRANDNSFNERVVKPILAVAKPRVPLPKDIADDDPAAEIYRNLEKYGEYRPIDLFKTSNFFN